MRISHRLTAAGLLGLLLAAPPLRAADQPLSIDAAPVADDHTVVLLHFDEGEGPVAHDASRFKNHGAIKGGAKYVDGKFGKALQFDGYNQAVDLAGERGQPASFDFGTETDFTIEFWMKSSTEQRWQFLVTKKLRGESTEPGVMILLQNKQLKALIADGVNGISVVHPATVVDGSWHHVALVAKRKGDAVLYVDGVAGAAVPMTQILDVTNTGRRMRIADREQEGDFEGAIDEVRISNVAREWQK